MSDDWEDWENQDFVIPVLSVQNEEQLKRLEERKLVEESDNALSRALFSDEEDLVHHELKKLEEKTTIKQLHSTEKKAPKKVPTNKQKENELRQKEISKKNKEEKAKKLREKEVFGEADEDDEYARYEDMFY